MTPELKSALDRATDAARHYRAMTGHLTRAKRKTPVLFLAERRAGEQYNEAMERLAAAILKAVDDDGR